MAPPALMDIPDDRLAALQGLLRQAAQARLSGGPREPDLELISLAWSDESDRQTAAQALADPYLAVGLLVQTLINGFRGNPLHRRPLDDDPDRLADDLAAIFRLHLRLRAELPGRVDWPEDGVSGLGIVGDGGWCDLCGRCCCHMGTVPHPPPGVDYPAWWYHALAGETIDCQPLCPFLFQARDAEVYLCSIHPIKPQACRNFDRADCERGRGFREGGVGGD